LQKQIEGGAPVDAFASAAHKQMNALVKGNLVDSASVKVFATNGMVLAVPANSTLTITSFQDLTKADVKKVAYADPKVAPVGVAAEEILTSLGIMDQVKPKVVYTANASQTVDYVVRGEVDAGIMFTTDAKAAGDKVKVVTTAEPGWYTPIEYPIGVVTASSNKSLAQAFADFVLGSEGQAILAKDGFLPPPAASSSTTSPPTT
jgi:molybdate transport system substrate-binding protein